MTALLIKGAATFICEWIDFKACAAVRAITAILKYNELLSRCMACRLIDSTLTSVAVWINCKTGRAGNAIAACIVIDKSLTGRMAISRVNAAAAGVAGGICDIILFTRCAGTACCRIVRKCCVIVITALWIYSAVASVRVGVNFIACLTGNAHAAASKSFERLTFRVTRFEALWTNTFFFIFIELGSKSTRLTTTTKSGVVEELMIFIVASLRIDCAFALVF